MTARRCETCETCEMRDTNEVQARSCKRKKDPVDPRATRVASSKLGWTIGRWTSTRLDWKQIQQYKDVAATGGVRRRRRRRRRRAADYKKWRWRRKDGGWWGSSASFARWPSIVTAAERQGKVSLVSVWVLPGFCLGSVLPIRPVVGFAERNIICANRIAWLDAGELLGLTSVSLCASL
ncbi:hypothetical protein ANO11243_021230 [Dothideomycetidae sp. 11243]|nr:hypothetical protein ANO11243_021230 [fungal sp. No.11243]